MSYSTTYKRTLESQINIFKFLKFAHHYLNFKLSLLLFLLSLYLRPYASTKEVIYLIQRSLVTVSHCRSDQLINMG